MKTLQTIIGRADGQKTARTPVSICLLLPILIVLFFSPTNAETIRVGAIDGVAQTDSIPTYHVALAISGGGARGFTSVGILRAFEEKGLAVSAVAGTSMGGIIGGLYASGYSPEQLTEIVQRIDFQTLFTNNPMRQSMFLTQREERDQHLLSVRFENLTPVIPKALTSGQELTLLLTTLTSRATYHSGGDFSKLPIPFATLATDLITGDEVVLDQGSLANAMRATMAYPLAFTGVERDGRLLMDGGMVTPIPVDLVRDMADSGEFVVAINTSGELLPRDELRTPIDIANQATTIMTADKLKTSLARADFIIAPALNGLLTSDFEYRDSLIEIGYRAGLTAADSIINILRQRQQEDPLYTRKVSPSYRPELDSSLATNWSQWRFEFEGNYLWPHEQLTTLVVSQGNTLTLATLEKGREAIEDKYSSEGWDLACVRRVEIDQSGNVVRFVIDEGKVEKIDVRGNLRSKDWYIRSYFPIRRGEPYSTRKAASGIANIYGTDLYERVAIDLRPLNGGLEVIIDVTEKKPTQLRFGWHWNDWFKSEEFIELLDDNVMGMGIKLLARAHYSPDRQKYLAGIRTNRLWSTYLTGRFELYHNRLDRQLYDRLDNATSTEKEIRSGISFQLGQQIARLGVVSATLVHEELEYRNEATDVSQYINLSNVRFVSHVENLNQFPFPESGKKHVFELEVSGRFLGGDAEYTRFYSSIEAYFRIREALHYHPKLAIGVSRNTLPRSERFYLGGTNSFAGFRTHQISGEKVFLISNELRYTLGSGFYLAGRYDFGDVYDRTGEIKPRNIRHGVGLWLSYDSPLGPASIGYGVANRQTDELYVDIGFRF